MSNVVLESSASSTDAHLVERVLGRLLKAQPLVASKSKMSLMLRTVLKKASSKFVGILCLQSKCYIVLNYRAKERKHI